MSEGGIRVHGANEDHGKMRDTERRRVRARAQEKTQGLRQSCPTMMGSWLSQYTARVDRQHAVRTTPHRDVDRARRAVQMDNKELVR